MQARAIAPHVSMGFNNMWILLNDVLPRAIQKHGGFGPDALAKAARETDIPEGGTMQGYGVKFHPRGQPDAPARTSARSPRSSRSSREVRGRLPQGRRHVRAHPAAARVLAVCAARLGIRAIARDDPAPGRSHAAPAPRPRRAERHRVDQAVRRVHRAAAGVLRGAGGRDPRAHRPERLGQDHGVQLHLGRAGAERGEHPLPRRGDRRASRPTRSATAGSPARSRSRARSAS